MAMRELHCPSCGAAPPPAVGPDGTYTCAYCGARYSLSVGAWGPGSRPGSPNASRTIAAIVAVPIVLVAVGGVVGAAIFLRARTTPPPPTPPPVAAPVEPIELAPPVAPPLGHTPVSVPAPPPEKPPTAEFVHHSTQKSLTNAIYVLGEVTNTSDFTIDKPEIFVVLVDEAGKEVAVENGFAAYDNLAPGETSPVEVLIMDPKPHASMRFETKLRKSTYIAPRAQGLELEVDPPVRDTFRGVVHTGKVHNKGSQPAQFVQVFCLARDEDGKLLDVDFTFATGEQALPAGASARFKTLGTRLEKEPAKYDLVVFGRPI